jgi:8-oxo-dGTP diphosphatase
MAYVPSSEAERAYLAAYRHERYPRPCVTVDVVALSVLAGELHTLLIKRGGFPYRGAWALPGGFVDVGDTFDDQGEDLDVAAARELAEETGVEEGSVNLTQLFAVGTPGRDPRTRAISVVYLGLVPAAVARRARAGDDASVARWSPAGELGAQELAFDHATILGRALTCFADQLERGAPMRPLVEEPFQLEQLEAMARAARGRTFDLTRFRRCARRLVADGALLRVAGAGRGRYRYP